MKSGIREDARTFRIISAIGLGINTSKKLAAAFETTIANMAPELHRLAGMGVIARGNTAKTVKGRPCRLWKKARQAAIGPLPSCSADDCEGKVYAKRLCHIHYQRKRRSGVSA